MSVSGLVKLNTHLARLILTDVAEESDGLHAAEELRYGGYDLAELPYASTFSPDSSDLSGDGRGDGDYAAWLDGNGAGDGDNMFADDGDGDGDGDGEYADVTGNGYGDGEVGYDHETHDIGCQWC